MKNTFILTISLALFSCGTNNKEKSEKLNESGLITEKQGLNNQNSTDQKSVYTNVAAQKAMEDFYRWYIYEIYQKDLSAAYQIPNFHKLTNGTYVFDVNSYINKLKEVTFFSEEFILSEKNKLETCNAIIATKAWTSEPDEQIEISECDYLLSDRWVGGQGEVIDGFKFKSLSEQNGEVLGLVDIQIEGKKFVESRVSVKINNGNYKITRITLNWD